MMITIRKATESDAEAVWNVRKEAILSRCLDYYRREVIEAWVEGKSPEKLLADVVANFYVAIVNNEVVGSGKINLDNGHIDAIFIQPDRMGQGVAGEMMKHLEKLARHAGLKTLTLDATLNAAGFYRSCGFNGDKVSTYASPRGIELDCVSMVKLIEYSEVP